MSDQCQLDWEKVLLVLIICFQLSVEREKPLTIYDFEVNKRDIHKKCEEWDGILVIETELNALKSIPKPDHVLI